MNFEVMVILPYKFYQYKVQFKNIRLKRYAATLRINLVSIKKINIITNYVLPLFAKSFWV